MPPLKSKHCIPVPAPTHPSSTGPPVAASSASKTSSSDNGYSSTSERNESSHSVTTGIGASSAVSGSCPVIHFTVAS